MGNQSMGQLLLSPAGRISRSGFWIGIGMQLVLALAAVALWQATKSDIIRFAAVALFGIALVWVGLVISIKRFHDRGKSGWWVLISFVPVIGAIWYTVECGFLPGDARPNPYGPDPLAA